MGKTRIERDRSGPTKHKGQKPYMQRWLLAVRDHLRNTPHEVGEPSQAMLQSVAAEIANRWGGANWNSGVGFRVSYSTLGQDLFFDRKYVSRCFSYWQAHGFLSPAGVWRSDRGLVHKWDATMPEMSHGDSSLSWDISTEKSHHTPTDESWCLTTLPSIEGEEAFASSPDPLEEELLRASPHLGTQPPHPGSPHPKNGVAPREPDDPTGTLLDPGSQTSPLLPTQRVAVSRNGAFVADQPEPLRMERKAPWVERKRDSYLANADAIRIIAAQIVDPCIEGPTDGQPRSEHVVGCLYRLANRIAAAYERSIGEDPEPPGSIERYDRGGPQQRAQTLHDILGWKGKKEGVCS